MDKLRFFSQNTAIQVRQTEKLRFFSPLILEYTQAKHTDKQRFISSLIFESTPDRRTYCRFRQTDGQNTFRFNLIWGSK